MLLDCALHRADLGARVDSVIRVLDATHVSPAGGGTVPDVSREARGLSVVLLYASYENLLKTLCRSLLETAAQLRVSNRRLKPGFRLFSVFNQLEAATAVTPAKIWRESGLDIVETLGQTRDHTIAVGQFPTDGTHMKRSQVATFCRVFNLGPPAPVLREVWTRLDTVVDERNAIAHGRLTADQVGRAYSEGDIRALADLWRLRWIEFLDHAEASAATRDFFRLPR